MWKRDLLFIGLLVGGGIALAANLLPSAKVRPLGGYDPHHYSAPAFQDTVAKVNRSFRELWATNNLQHSAPASDLQVARRISLGLMGTVPSLAEIRQIEALPAAERIPWWTDHVLEDRRFADYFGERFARAYVGTEDGPFVLFRRRRFVAWIADQIAANRPYDALVRDLIADDGLWTDKPATNFVSVTAQQDNQNQPSPVRLAGRVTRAFLGLRLDCAECHNHPFTHWKQRDFEGLAAFFGQTKLGLKGIQDGAGEFEATERRSQEKYTVYPDVPYSPELVPSTGTRRQKLAEWVTHPKNSYFAKATVNRVWALVTGRPLIEPIDNLETPPDQPPPAALEMLAEDFVAHQFDLKRLIRLIVQTEVFHLDSAATFDATDKHEATFAVFPLTRLRPEQVAGGLLQTASIATLDRERHILLRLVRYGDENNFVKRYGDNGEDEFDGNGGTIPQRLLLMNGEIVREKLKDSPLNAATRISMMSADNRHAVETAYLCILSRRPTALETAHFEQILNDPSIKTSRTDRILDLYWVLLNSTEFSWNH